MDPRTRTVAEPPEVHAFPGDGEMSRRVREFDWARTSLGPLAQWPAELRAALGICLDSSLQLAVYWGPDLLFFYNDAMKATLGAKHPAAFAQPARTVWPELWETLGPVFERVRTQAEATRAVDLQLPFDRHGSLEECYCDRTYSPIRGSDGRVEGVFGVVVETTSRVIGERRARVVREITEKTAGALSPQEACTLAAQALSAHGADLAFCLLYLMEPGPEAVATLAGISGLEPGTAASPRRIVVRSGAAPWPLGRILDGGTEVLVENLGARGAFALPGGAWPEPCTRALVLPVGGSHAATPDAILVAGLSPRLPLDAAYRAFVKGVAVQVGAAVDSGRLHDMERQRAEALAQLDRAKTAFFSNVSHEFRTPLTLIRGPVEEMLAGDAGPISPQQQERLEMLHRNAVRLHKLVNTLLEFARVEAGRTQACYEPVDLARLTREICSAFDSAVSRAGLAMTLDCRALEEPVFVDSDLWEKIVLNLVSNALKFTFEGGIRISLEPAPGAAVLRVSDTGVGIPSAELPHIFERFHRSANTRSRTGEGSGIGLALVQELVKLHGGKIEVESALGKGSTFSVAIPTGTAHLPAERLRSRRVGSEAPGAATAAYVKDAHRWLPDNRRHAWPHAVGETTVPPVPREAQPGPERVLVADDNADMRHYIRRLLEPHWHVETAEDGAKAMASALARPPDLVVSDVMMPGMDGFQLLRALRADSRTARLPVILLSARAGEEASIAGMAAGADDYLVKPFGARELIARVAARLEISRMRRENERHVTGILEALRESEERMRLATEAARIYAWDIDLSTGQVSYSDTMARVYGYESLPPEFLDVDTAFDFVHADDLERIKRLMHVAIHETGVINAEYRARLASGGYMWVECHGRRVEATAIRDSRLVGVAQDITERKRAEEQLRDSKERLRLALDTARIFSWEADLETGLVTRSANHAEVLGFELPSEVKPGFAQTHREDRELVQAAFDRATRGEGIFQVECRVVDPSNGSIVWTRSHGVLFPGAGGGPGRMVGITQNITERKRAEENTRRDERNSEFLRQLELLISPMLEADEIVSIATRRLGEYLELTRCYVSQPGDTFIILRGDWRRAGLPSVAGVHPLEGILPAAFRAAFDMGQSVVVNDLDAEALDPEVRDRLHGMGAQAYLCVPYVSGVGWESTLVAQRDMPHEWQAHEVQLMRDVSSRLWPAVKRARAERAMRDSEERFRTMADSSPVMIWITDTHGRIEFANRAFLDFFGIATRERARDFAWGETIHPEDREAYFDAFAATVGERAPFEARARVRRRDGLMRWVESRGNPRLDAHGKVTGVIGSSPDITEMFESQQALREADRRKDEFLAMLAHELRNPLAPIVNATRILRRLAPLGPELEGMREMIERQTEQLTTLVDDLLDVSRVTQGRITLRKVNLELMSVIARAIETSRPLIDARRHHLAISLPAEPVRIEGDVARLAQAISNLLNNAAKYTDDGGELQLKAQVEEGQVVVTIKDNGIGLEPEELLRIFDLFTQADRALDRAQGGLGIGLTVVKKLIEMHGGRVHAYSEGHGRGSEFVVTLPTVTGVHEDRKGASGAPPKAAARSRILVVDDNVDSATSMSLLLKLDGHDVKMAHDGPGALAAARAFHPQVILLDIGLPGMSGYEVARELRRDETFAQVTLIALTGYGQAEDRRKSKAAGFDHHLTKPVDDEALATVLESMQGSSTTSS
jgi:PAS domain S-box-containing protein